MLLDRPGTGAVTGLRTGGLEGRGGLAWELPTRDPTGGLEERGDPTGEEIALGGPEGRGVLACGDATGGDTATGGIAAATSASQACDQCRAEMN